MTLAELLSLSCPPVLALKMGVMLVWWPADFVGRSESAAEAAKANPFSLQSVTSPDTAWQPLVHSRLAFIGSLAACSLFLACPFTSRNAEKPVLWLIAELPSTPMGQVSSSLAASVHFSLQPLRPCLCSASSGAPSGLHALSINFTASSAFSFFLCLQEFLSLWWLLLPRAAQRVGPQVQKAQQAGALLALPFPSQRDNIYL